MLITIGTVATSLQSLVKAQYGENIRSEINRETDNQFSRNVGIQNLTTVPVYVENMFGTECSTENSFKIDQQEFISLEIKDIGQLFLVAGSETNIRVLFT